MNCMQSPPPNEMHERPSHTESHGSRNSEIEQKDKMGPLHNFSSSVCHRRDSHQARLFTPRSSFSDHEIIASRSESYNDLGQPIQGEINMRFTYEENLLKICVMSCNILGPKVDASASLDLYCKIKFKECGANIKPRKFLSPLKACEIRNVDDIFRHSAKDHHRALSPQRSRSSSTEDLGMLFSVLWEFEFCIENSGPLTLDQLYASLDVSVYVKGDSSVLGYCKIPLDGLIDGVSLEGYYPLLGNSKRGSFSIFSASSKAAMQERLLSVVGRLVKHSKNQSDPDLSGRKIQDRVPFRKVISLRAIFVMLITFQLVIAVAVTTSLTYMSAKNELENSASQLVLKTAQSIQSELDYFFVGPSSNTLSIAQNYIFQDPLHVNTSLLLLFSALNSSSNYNLSSTQTLYFGLQSGVFASATLSEVSFALPPQVANNSRVVYNITNPTCEYWDTLCLLYNPSSPFQESSYNLFQRFWYTTGAAATGLTWTSPYLFASSNLLGITAVSPMFAIDSGQFSGVAASDLLLNHISRFLSNQNYYVSGLSFMVEVSTGYLFAASVDLDEVNSFPRIFANSSSVPDIRVTSAFLQSTSFDECHGISDTQCIWSSCSNGQTYFSGGNVITAVRYNRRNGLDLVIVVVIPYSDFSSSFNKMVTIAVIVGIVLLALSVLVSVILVNMFTKELIIATKQLRKFACLEFSEDSYEAGVNSPIKEISRIYYALTNMRSSLKSFTKYVPVDVVRGLVKDNQVAKIGGDRRVLTVLFSDIVNFTRISEELNLDELITIMGEYLEEMSSTIVEYEGTVDKYIGDSIMALWNAPELVPDHAVKACAAAIEYQRRLKRFSDEWVVKGYPQIMARIGIHTGEAIVGNFGARERLNYTALGDNVNLSSRLEALNKEYGTSIMISEETYKAVQDRFLCRPLDIVAVKGKHQPSVVFELICPVESASVAQIEDVRLFARALESIKSKRIMEAQQLFTVFLQNHPKDRAAQIHLASCKHFLSYGLPDSWNGIRVMVSK
eukprot:Sdes_comp20790_c0_seq1m16981